MKQQTLAMANGLEHGAIWRSYGEGLRCNVRNMNPEIAEGLSTELQQALEPLLAAIESLSERIREYQKVNPQHPLCPHRGPPISRVGVHRFDQRTQLCSRHHLLHVLQERPSSCFLCVASPAPSALAPVRLAPAITVRSACALALRCFPRHSNCGSIRAKRASVRASSRSSFLRLSRSRARCAHAPRSLRALTRSTPGSRRASAFRFPLRSGSAACFRTLLASLSESGS
jgi:hypothetical protein